MYPSVRSLLFRLDPERAHDLVLGGLHWAGRSVVARRLLRGAYGTTDPRLAVEAFGLRFPSPVGLAAGLDKDGMAVPALAALGFGSLELGTVTARPQPGNPRPRLFRLPEDDALINRMGFNNRGAEALARRLARLRQQALVDIPIGVNVGKSRAAALEDAVEDYRRSLRTSWPVADYLALNVSSPNTPGLRSLQERAALEALLQESARIADELGPKPLLLKIAPDLDDDALPEIVEAAESHGVAGLIATNTTIARDGLASPHRDEAGGLSGRPLAERSTQVLRMLRSLTDLPIVSVGGIWDDGDAADRLAAGATLVQIYTAFIYRGPGVLKRLNDAVLDRLERDGLDSVAELSLRATATARRRPPPAR